MNELLLPRVEELNNDKKFEAALELLTDEALNDQPTAELFVERAIAYRNLKQKEKALSDCHKAIQLNPVYYKSYLLMGGIMRDTRDYERAVEYYTKAVELNNSSAKAWNAQGIGLDDIGEFDKAIESYSTAIELDPESPDAWYNRAKAWQSKNEFDKAIADYNKSLELDPEFVQAYNNRGIVWDDKQEYEKAIADYTKALELAPSYYLCYNNRGSAWRSLGQYDNALADYNATLAIEPEYTDTYINRGELWFITGNYNKAIEDYTRAIQLSPNSSLSYRSRAQVWYEKHDYNKAMADVQKALELKPDDLTAAYLRDRIKAMLGEVVVTDKKRADESFYLFVKAVENLPEEDQYEILIAGNRIMETAVKKIRKHAAARTGETVAHYTKLPVADLLVSGNESRLRYYNAVYMNDPEEGMVVMDALHDPEIQRAFEHGFERGESNIYLGSFLPVERSDDLVMWRTYGKDENNVDAAGCCLVVDAPFFDERADMLNPDMRRTGKRMQADRISSNLQSLHKVLYYNKHNDEFTGTAAPQLKSDMIELREALKNLLQLKTKNASEKKDIAIDKIVYHIISEIRYFFKSADYAFENELRVIQFAPLDSDTVQVDDRTLPKRLYINSSRTVQPYISRIVLGPKVPHPERWIYLEAVLKKKIHGHNMKLHRSECRYQ